MTVAIVDYGSGNLHSAAKAFERAARESGHDQPIVVTNDPDKVRAADRVVLPPARCAGIRGRGGAGADTRLACRVDAPRPRRTAGCATTSP